MSKSTAEIVTWLYVPADQPARVEKALAAATDAVIIDLEDAVAADRKPHARDELRVVLAAPRPKSGPSIWVRVNADSTEDDLAAAHHPAVDGICLPKVSGPEEVVALERQLEALDERSGRSRPTLIMPLIETAPGVANATSIASSARVALLQLGEQDLRVSLRLPPSLAGAAGTPAPLWVARSQVVLASAVAQIDPPIAPVSTTIHDASLLQTETRELRAGGFGSRAVVHPAQLEPVSVGFTPSDEEVAWAEEIVAAGISGVSAVGGRMVDAPVLAQAQHLLRVSARLR
jgi:citrate lyase subunit beta/citryl-CoA lyase